MSFQIQEIDTRDAPEDLIRELWQFYGLVRVEELPDDPPVPFERQLADLRTPRDDELVMRWALRDDGEIVAVAVAFVNLEQNLDNGYARIHVRSDRRREGLGRRLAPPALEMLSGHSRKRLETYVIDGHAAEAVPAKAGLKMVYKEKRSRLIMSEVPMGEMRVWVERASERAGDYELLYLEPPFPSPEIDKYCELQFEMNTAPLEDYEQDDEVITPTVWRDIEEKTNASFHGLHTLVAVHRPTGDFVGSTTVTTDLLQVDQGWQWETVVHSDHRNMGLGRWLKAAMVEKVAADHPSIERIDTWNAGSNEPMLNINIAMGFKPILTINTWQGDLEVARNFLIT